MVLSAPPGYGKTALLRELLPALEASQGSALPWAWGERLLPRPSNPQAYPTWIRRPTSFGGVPPPPVLVGEPPDLLP